MINNDFHTVTSTSSDKNTYLLHLSPLLHLTFASKKWEMCSGKILTKLPKLLSWNNYNVWEERHKRRILWAIELFIFRAQSLQSKQVLVDNKAKENSLRSFFQQKLSSSQQSGDCDKEIQKSAIIENFSQTMQSHRLNKVLRSSAFCWIFCNLTENLRLMFTVEFRFAV